MSKQKPLPYFNRAVVVDVLSRAAKTFVQALTAQILVADLFAGDVAKVHAALVAALAAAISVVWNAAIEWANS